VTEKEYVLVRTYSAGVHLGYLESRHDMSVVLHNARRLWFWKGAFSLNEVATDGIKFHESRLSAVVPEIVLTQAIEIIPLNADMAKKFQEAKVYKP
jgi:hypothetical protein